MWGGKSKRNDFLCRSCSGMCCNAVNVKECAFKERLKNICLAKESSVCIAFDFEKS